MHQVDNAAILENGEAAGNWLLAKLREDAAASGQPLGAEDYAAAAMSMLDAADRFMVMAYPDDRAYLRAFIKMLGGFAGRLEKRLRGLGGVVARRPGGRR